MDINKFILEVNSVNWNRFSSEAWSHYKPENVPHALIALALADKGSADFLYIKKGEKIPDSDDMLSNAPVEFAVYDAIGNNHAGVYHAAIREALPFIIQVALFGNHLVARHCAIDILITLYCTFSPSSWSDESKELEKFVKETIRSTVLENRQNLNEFALACEENKLLVDELMEIID